MAVLPDREVKARIERVTPRGYSADEVRAFRIGVMVGARAAQFGPILESYVAGLYENASAEQLEHEVRGLADILLAPPLGGSGG